VERQRYTESFLLKILLLRNMLRAASDIDATDARVYNLGNLWKE